MSILSNSRFRFKNLKVDFTYKGKKYKDVDFSKMKVSDGSNFHSLTRLEFKKYFGRSSKPETRPDFYYTESFGKELILDASMFTFKLDGKVLTPNDVASIAENPVSEPAREANPDDDSDQDSFIDDMLLLDDGEKFSFITPAKIPDENDPKKNVSVLKIKNFKAVEEFDFNDDNYIRVKLSGTNREVVVKIKDLKTVKTDKDGKRSSISSKDLNKFIDKSVIVTVDGVDYETEKLTKEQIDKRYDSIKAYVESRSSVATENTYLKTADGLFVKEIEAFQPISYKKVKKGEPCTHYMFKIGSGNKSKTVIVSADYVNKFAGETIKIDGYVIEKSKGTGLVRCNFNECDVVQTSTDGEDFNTCELTTKSSKDSTQNNENDLNKKWNKCFDLYKKGEYEIKDTYMFGSDNPVGLFTNKRYEYTDEYIIDDKTAELHNYKNTKFEPLRYEYNGKKVKLKGGPKYSFEKGIRNSYKKLFKVALYSLAASISVPGMLAIAVAPMLVGAYVAGLVAAAVLIPVVHGVKALTQKIVKNFKDKVKYNRKNNDVAHKANLLSLRVKKELTKAKKNGLTPEQKQCLFNSTLNEFNVLEQELLMNGTAHYDANFAMKDGVGAVNPGNARFAGEFAKETNKMIRQQKRLEAAHKRFIRRTNKGKNINPILQKQEEKYNDLGKNIKERTTNYIAENPDYKPAKGFEKQKVALKVVKNIALMQIDPLSYGLTMEEASVVQKININMNFVNSKSYVEAFGAVAISHKKVLKRIIEKAKTSNMNVELEGIPDGAPVPVEQNDERQPNPRIQTETERVQQGELEHTNEEELGVS